MALFSNFRSYLAKVLFLVGTARRKLAMLLPLYLVSSMVDLVGIGLLIALISALKDPETLTAIVESIPVVSRFAASGTPDALTIMLAGLVLLVYAVKTGIALYVTKLTLKISFNYGAQLRSFLMGVYQHYGYAKFIERNSSKYIYNVQTLAGQFVTYTIQPMLRIIGDGFLALLIIIYLAVNDPFVLTVLFVLMSMASLLYDRAYRKKIAAYGSRENALSSSMIKSISEGLSAYKESHIFGSLGFFHRAVAKAAAKLADLRVRSQLITAASRYVLEFVIVISVVCVIVASVAFDHNKGDLLTTLALFLVASMRLVPATNQIVTSVGRLRYGRHSVEILHTDIAGAGFAAIDFNVKWSEQEREACSQDDVRSFHRLELHGVGFRYTPNTPWVLDSVNLSIERYDIVGIVGASGSGKTTLIDLMLGFLSPQHGRVICDGVNLDEPQHVKAWHKKVAYLPQEVFLIDDTLARNVALGIDAASIDRDKLGGALLKARLIDLTEKMTDGMDTHVGEKGLWVSGGQRQRIALARAFYHDAEVLIMDESTSALDGETADEIINELRLLKGKATIVIIAHQEALLRLCNKVYRLEDGKLLQQPA